MGLNWNLDIPVRSENSNMVEILAFLCGWNFDIPAKILKLECG